MTQDPTDFLAQLEMEVRCESAAARDRLERIFSQPLERQKASGWTLHPVRLHLDQRGNRAWLEGNFSRSRYREGDLLQLRRPEMERDFGLEAAILHEEGHRLHLMLRSGSPDPFLDTDLLAEPAFFDLSRFYYQAIQECGITHLGRERVLPLLMGDLKPTVDASSYLDALDEGERLGFNPEQSEAYASCLACDPAHHVQGPPGTGKTRVLAEVALALARKGQRVWISALTHRAIDHALAVIHTLDPRIPLAKISDPELGTRPGVPLHGYFNACPLAAMDGGYVIGATPFATRSRRLQDWTADTVILDEASQITLPLALMAMLRAERVLFFGDQCQLPPVQLSCSPIESTERSILARLPGGDMRTLLRTTYRLHPELCGWPNRNLYHDALTAAASAIDYRPELLSLPVDLPAQRLLCIPTRSQQQGMTSDEEAEKAALICRQLCQQGLDPTDLAILTPFRAQARRIRVALGELPVLTDTVEHMQGQERDVILLSMGVSDPDWVQVMASFLFLPARLNVALTRARGKCIVLASPALVDVELFEEPVRSWQRAFADLMPGALWR